MIGPYLRRKIEATFLKYREEVADGVLGSNSKLSKLKQFFVSLYPHIHLVLEALDFCKSSSFMLTKYINSHSRFPTELHLTKISAPQSSELLAGNTLGDLDTGEDEGEGGESHYVIQE